MKSAPVSFSLLILIGWEWWRWRRQAFILLEVYFYPSWELRSHDWFFSLFFPLESAITSWKKTGSCCGFLSRSPCPDINLYHVDCVSFWGTMLEPSHLWTCNQEIWREMGLYFLAKVTSIAQNYHYPVVWQVQNSLLPVVLLSMCHWVLGWGLGQLVFSWAVMGDFFSLYVSWMLWCSPGPVWRVQRTRVHHWHSQLCLSGKCLQSNPW